LSRSHSAAAVHLVVLLEQVIAWFIVDLEQPSKRKSRSPVARRLSWPNFPSTPTREVSGSFPNSFSRLQWNRSFLADDKPKSFTMSGSFNLSNQHSIKSSSLIAIGYNCSLRSSFRGSVNAQPWKGLLSGHRGRAFCGGSRVSLLLNCRSGP
jgi:hypothetical protein